MRLPSFLRRSKPTPAATDFSNQLDLFGDLPALAPVVSPQVLAIVQTVAAPQPVELEPAPTPASIPAPIPDPEPALDPGVVKVILDDPAPRPSRDFRITDAHRIGQGGLAEKARDNVAAIRTLKALEAEERDATDDEKTTLARYVGWGAMSNVFGYYPPDHLAGPARELKNLLTDSEYTSAKASTPNAHYTSPMVIKAVWEGLRRIGVGAGVQILEPAMGVGHFFGLMPNDMQGGNRTGVELDSITARIAKKLYPDATIFAKGFEETPLPDNYFDCAVGNVPFGDYAVHDPSMKHSMTRAIHDYFFAKSLEKVRPGGVMALITSRYTMDKENETVRKNLSEQRRFARRDQPSEHRLQGKCRNRGDRPTSFSCKSANPVRRPLAMLGAALT